MKYKVIGLMEIDLICEVEAGSDQEAREKAEELFELKGFQVPDENNSAEVILDSGNEWTVDGEGSFEVTDVMPVSKNSK